MRGYSVISSLHQTLSAIVISAILMSLNVTATAEPNAVQKTELDPNCRVERCETDEGIVVEVLTNGEQKSSQRATQNDRRVDITLKSKVAETSQYPANIKGEFFVRMPYGGMFWATEDPALLTPRLSVTGPSEIELSSAQDTELTFYYYANYRAFIYRLELALFRADDYDQINPIVRKKIRDFEEKGDISVTLDPSMVQALRSGQALKYRLRAYDKQGNYDETFEQITYLVKAKRSVAQTATKTRSNSNQSNSSLVGFKDQSLNTQNRSSSNQTSANSDSLSQNSLNQSSLNPSSLEQNGFSTNNIGSSVAGYGKSQLARQTIPLNGSRIRIYGQDIPEGFDFSINGKRYPIDSKRKVAAEFILPEGQYSFDLALSNQDQKTAKTLLVDVTGKYWFLAALADITATKQKLSGSVEALDEDDPFQKDFLVEGRLAFYLKGKIKGKYLLTAQADTQEKELSSLFNGFLDKDPQDLFRRLDPDRYYPVYGDDSTVVRDIDTQGRLYVRLDWDKSVALWGNYNTGLTDTEAGQFNRSLYGAILSWKSTDATEYGDTRTQFKVFGSEAQTAFGHTEFLGTGGSLYYLKHTDILSGSEKITLELQDPDTGRTLERVDLVADRDYDFDAIQGRIILNAPLYTFTSNGQNTLIRDNPLDGNQYRLLVDYEYIPSGFDTDHVTAGTRIKHWFNDHVALGTTVVDENRAGDDYQLAAVDATFKAGKGTYVTIEHAQTDNTQAPIFFSNDGGFNFTERNAKQTFQRGEMQSVQARINLQEQDITDKNAVIEAWYRAIDAGFSTSTQDASSDREEYGAQWYSQLTDKLELNAHVSRKEQGDNTLDQASLGTRYYFNSASIAAELKQQKETQSGDDVDALLFAMEYRHRVLTPLELYAIAQGTVDADPTYDNNDLLTVGANYQASGQTRVGLEYSQGHRGEAASLDAQYQVNDDNTVYGRYTWSADTTAPALSPFSESGFVIGHRSALTSKLNMYNERQTITRGPEAGLIHAFGLDYRVTKQWHVGLSLQNGDVSLDGEDVKRESATITTGYKHSNIDWLSKFEFREDDGSENTEQWLTTNRLFYKINTDWRLAAKYNYSDSTNQQEPEDDAKFVEGSLGFAYRPISNNRWNWLGKYTYLYDLRALNQTNSGTDQKSDIFTTEGLYRINKEWAVAAKLGRRTGQLRQERGTGRFFRSTVDFRALQLRYHLVKEWDGLVEARQLKVQESNSKRFGWLVGVDRHIGDHFKMGLGYNFTNFSDDLRYTDYRYQGFFLNLVGKY